MTSWKTRLYRIGAFILALFVLGGGYLFATKAPSGMASPDAPAEVPPPPEVAPLQDQQAPDFTLERMNGDTFRLSDHRGKIVVVNFWATWCPPCRQEIPDFVKMQDDLGDEGVLFVGVSEDEEGFEVVRPFAEEMEINYPLVVDDGSVAPKYGGVYALPTTFIVGPEGNVRYSRAGMVPERLLRPQLEELLEEVQP